MRAFEYNNNKDATIREIYAIFVKNNIVEENELDVLDEWITLVSQFTKE